MMINSIQLRLTPAKILSQLVFAVACCSSAVAQSDWTPNILADGQPDIGGMWNNVGATATPLELPEQFQGREPSQEEIVELIRTRDEARKSDTWTGFENSSGVGAYENYWFDWYWSDAVADAPASDRGAA